MRTLSDSLLKAQKQAFVNNLYKIVLTKGASTYTYEKDRILPSAHDEEPYSHKATIVLNNSDGALDDIDLRGYKGILSYGAVASGEEYSATAPVWVMDQQFDSDPNKLICTLELEGAFNLMADDEASANYIPDADDTKTVKDLANGIVGATLAPFTLCKAYEIVWDTGYDALADTYKPKDGFRIYTGGNRLAALRRVLDYTANVARWEDDGKVHILKPVTTGTTYDSEYSLERGDHKFFSKAYKNTLVIPNKIYVKSYADDDPQYSGSAQIADYASLPDEVKKIRYIQAKLESNAQAEDIAEALIAKAEMWSKRGAAEVPLNVGAEVFDYVKVTDSRQGDTRTGNLGYVHRRFGKDKWLMTFGFGNWLDQLKYNQILKELETYTDAGQYFSRLSVGDLYVEHILADSLDMVWIDPEGNIDLDKIGDNLDNLPNGEVYARIKSMHLDAGVLQLNENVVYKAGYDPNTKRRNFTATPTTPYDLGDMWTDGTVLKRCTTARATGAYVAGDWTQVGLDAIADGSVYHRVKSAALSADGLVLLDQVTVGTYGLVLTADISAGHIKLDSVVTGTYGLVKATDISAGHILLSTCDGDLDDIDNGSTYEKLRATDIYSGHIDLTSSLYAHGEWYDYGGVVLDADTGIEIYGTAVLSVYTDASVYRGCLSAEGDNFIIWGAKDIFFDLSYGNGNIIIYSDTTAKVNPYNANQVSLGDSTHYWQYVYAYLYYGKITTIGTFQEHDDIGLLRAIKTKDGKLDIDTFPREITETDQELEESYQSAVTKLNGQEKELQDGLVYLQAKKREEEGTESKSPEDVEKKDKRVKEVGRRIQNTQEAIVTFNKRKQKELKNIEDAKKVRGVNLLGWQSLLMGSILQLADKLDALEQRL